MKIVILINPYLDKASEFYQAERLSAEFSALGVACDTKKNVSLAEIGGGILETLSKEYDACVYLDKDKYIPRMLEEKGMRLFNRATAPSL